MKEINKDSQWIKYSGLITREQYDWLNDCTESTGSWDIDEKGLVNVTSNFYCCGISGNPLNRKWGFNGLKFGRIGGNFHSNDQGLVTLDGCPRYVGKNCYLGHNKLVSTKGAPEEVGETLALSHNNIISLEGITTKFKTLHIHGNAISLQSILMIHGYMNKKEVIFEMALVNVWNELREKDKLILTPYYPENAELYRDIANYSIIK